MSFEHNEFLPGYTQQGISLLKELSDAFSKKIQCEVLNFLEPERYKLTQYPAIIVKKNDIYHIVEIPVSASLSNVLNYAIDNFKNIPNCHHILVSQDQEEYAKKIMHILGYMNDWYTFTREVSGELLFEQKGLVL